MNVSLPAPCAQIHAPLVLENPSTGMRCIVDAKIDTGSFATLGDFSSTHYDGEDGCHWLKFEFNLIEEDWLV